MNAPLWVALPVVVLAVLAARADVRERRIPNALTGPAIVLALLAHFWFQGLAGLRDSLVGLLIAGGLLLPGFLLRFTGAGDVKLMAGYGALLGPGRLLEAALCTALIGGVMAAGALLIRKCRIWLKAPKGGDPERMNSIPYAPAISLGALVALLPNV